MPYIQTKQLQVEQIHPVNAPTPPVNPRAGLGAVLPSSPQFTAQLNSYTLQNNVLTLSCSYTANWNFPLSNIEVQGSIGSEDFTISNVTYTTFDVVIDSSSYSNAEANNGGTLMVTTKVWGQWQQITSTISLNANVVTPNGTINFNATNGNNINIKTTA